MHSVETMPEPERYLVSTALAFEELLLSFSAALGLLLLCFCDPLLHEAVEVEPLVKADEPELYLVSRLVDGVESLLLLCF